MVINRKRKVRYKNYKNAIVFSKFTDGKLLFKIDANFLFHNFIK